MISNETLKILMDALEGRLPPVAVWIYGSEARGTARADSDLDVACLFATSPSPEELLAARAALGDALGRPVDLVDAGRASPILAMQILRRGRLVLDRDPKRRHQLEAGATGRYEDLKITRRPVELALIARLSNG